MMHTHTHVYTNVKTYFDAHVYAHAQTDVYAYVYTHSSANFDKAMLFFVSVSCIQVGIDMCMHMCMGTYVMCVQLCGWTRV